MPVGRLAIGIEFPNHEKSDRRYLANLQELVGLCNPAVDRDNDPSRIVANLDLESGPTTAAPSGVMTPSERNVYYNCGIIGKGIFGEVHKVIQGRSGRCFAKKTFFRPTNKRRRGEVHPTWLTGIRREFKIMEQSQHVSYLTARVAEHTLNQIVGKCG